MFFLDFKFARRMARECGETSTPAQRAVLRVGALFLAFRIVEPNLCGGPLIGG
jgi:hypothetical protein